MLVVDATYPPIDLPCVYFQDGTSVGLAAAQVTTATTAEHKNITQRR